MVHYHYHWTSSSHIFSEYFNLKCFENTECFGLGGYRILLGTWYLGRTWQLVHCNWFHFSPTPCRYFWYLVLPPTSLQTLRLLGTVPMLLVTVQMLLFMPHLSPAPWQIARKLSTSLRTSASSSLRLLKPKSHHNIGRRVLSNKTHCFVLYLTNFQHILHPSSQIIISSRLCEIVVRKIFLHLESNRKKENAEAALFWK